MRPAYPIPARGDHRRIVKVFDDSTAGYEIPWEGDPALLASQLTEQESLNEPSLEKASTEYSATLGTSTAQERVKPFVPSRPRALDEAALAPSGSARPDDRLVDSTICWAYPAGRVSPGRHSSSSNLAVNTSTTHTRHRHGAPDCRSDNPTTKCSSHRFQSAGTSPVSTT
jgi:hypothetical protein